MLISFTLHLAFVSLASAQIRGRMNSGNPAELPPRGNHNTYCTLYCMYVVCCNVQLDTILSTQDGKPKTIYHSIQKAAALLQGEGKRGANP
ncbi:hypothetical protein ACRALDRAFT_2020098 [Sodiomyces alcalophilus JCM 7366]|uniref:uncharacterized protein n=1 Tax=Sodiomyces alcalophilus JCM 7366 TaxID=591952 RepID=UPI0039B4F06A